MSNKIVRGTMLLTGAALLSKILGMIYVIPFNALVGADGGTLYLFAYNPYTILLSISTVGVPLAVSKIVSKYNSLGDYQTSLRVFKVSAIMMIISGIIAFLLLYLGAEWIANRALYNEGKLAGENQSITVEQVTAVIKMVSFALIIIPVMSVIRGFFQGFQSMGPTAVSEVIEQIVRIIFVLVSAFIVIIVYKGHFSTAVNYATFAAFIGGIASMAVLVMFWQKRKHHILLQAHRQSSYVHIPTKQLVVELLSYAGPFILVGIATPLYQNVDTFTFNKAMTLAGLREQSTVAFSAINLYGHKIILIPVTIATGLSLAIIPAITQSFTEQNLQKVYDQITQALQIVLFLVIPAVAGIMILGTETYGTLYGLSDIKLTGMLMSSYAPVALLFALFTVTCAILQGINEQRFVLVSLLFGLVLKILFNTKFIITFGPVGSIIATGLAVFVVVSLNMFWIYRTIQLPLIKMIKRTLFMVIFSLMMMGTIFIIKWILGFVVPFETNRTWMTIVLMFNVALGGYIYFYLTFKSTLIYYVFDDARWLQKIARFFP